MVSGTAFNEAGSALQELLNNYANQLSNISSSWAGLSHDSIISKADDFRSSYGDVILNEMAAFATACDLYIDYVNTKNAFKTAEQNMNLAIQQKDNRNARTFDRDRVNYANQMSSLASQINNYLSQAASTKLDATSVKPTSPNTGDPSSTTSTNGLTSSFTSGKPLNMEPGVHLLEFTTSTGKKIKYNVIIPEGATEGMPVIMYLNGDAHIGQAKNLGYCEMAEEVKKVYGDKAPFIVVQPVAPTPWYDTGATDGLNELVSQVVADTHANPRKVILSGASGGGIGCWTLIDQYPNLFSAFVPVSSYPKNVDFTHFTQIPIRAITSGDRDSDLRFMEGSQKAVEQINANGGHATYEEAGSNHGGIIRKAYTQELFEWMISQ